MVKQDQVYQRKNLRYLILSNTDDNIVYRELERPTSKLYCKPRNKFEEIVENGEFQKIEWKKKYFKSPKHLMVGRVYRHKNTLYKILSNAEGMIVFREHGFRTSKHYQTSHSKFTKLIDKNIISERVNYRVEIGDIYILARTNYTYEIQSIDRNAMIIKRFYKNEWKICKNYGFYQFIKDVLSGKYILISKIKTSLNIV